MDETNGRIEILHYPPPADRFFEGHSGFQIRALVTQTWFGRRRIKELDREEVPHWHYVQQRTLGSSSWRSKFAQEIQSQETP